MQPNDRFDAAAALRPLRAFQRRTVDYVYRRFFEDEERTRHFLVADEVGLGKTLVARGVIAKTIEHLWDRVRRIDILYICSNQAIAAQNVNRLNVLGRDAFSLPTRMTLIPLQLKEGLEKSRVNFVSLTPGTTFDLRSSTGVVRERALLFRLLEDRVNLRCGLFNLLQVAAGADRWEGEVAKLSIEDVDKTLVRQFQAKLEEQRPILEELSELANLFHRRSDSYPHEMITRRNALIGELRSLLSHVCVDALEPDLIILDEFQRFSDLLHSDHDAAILAQTLFNYVDGEGNAAKTLLLSATPYRMLTLSGDEEAEGDHYRDFLETVCFLFGRKRGAEVAANLEREMALFRRALFGLPGSKDECLSRKASIETTLRQVIARTERVSSTKERDSMVKEPPLPASVLPEDLRHAALIAAVARVAEAPDIVEYWKSAPYLLNFMRDYSLKRRLQEPAVARNPAVLDAIGAAKSACLDRSVIDSYREIVPPNGRMRALMDDIFSQGLARQLWIPPSMPYYGEPQGEGTQPPTKALVFSSWSMVPDALAALLSYEAERRMGVGEVGMNYFAHQRPRPLQFREAQGRLAGLRALHLVYPSPVLAEIADPLEVVAARVDLLSYEEMRAALAERLRPLLGRLQENADTSAETETWEWAGPAVLDALSGNRAVDWISDDEGFRGLGEEDAYTGHVDALAEAVRAGGVGGEVPNSALDLLVDISLGSAAVCALRALRRIAPSLAWDDPVLLTSASWIAWGFRTLYNQHDAVALLRGGDDEHYWHAVLRQAARDNLQATMDEYLHSLAESEGLIDVPAEERVEELSDVVNEVLSLRPSQIEVDAPEVRDGRLQIERFTLRGRFAMRLAEYKDEEGTANRLSSLRDAFNSPFRPFVLATTSIGQEGLDFHPYCYRLYHWNLPNNPVDLEQREGRVHRYKGHAVRLNVASQNAHVLRGSGSSAGDPWRRLFDKAREAAGGGNDLVPFWLYDGPVKVERRVPLLPYSREATRLQRLKRSTAVYRLAFGQPRQDDLLIYLEGLPDALPAVELDHLQIRLTP